MPTDRAKSETFFFFCDRARNRTTAGKSSVHFALILQLWMLGSRGFQFDGNFLAILNVCAFLRHEQKNKQDLSVIEKGT